MLLNAFELPDQSVTREAYPDLLMHLNATQPEHVARLPLEVCRLQDFLDKVLGPLTGRGWSPSCPQSLGGVWCWVSAGALMGGSVLKGHALFPGDVT